MPTFDFTCQDCEHSFEFTRPFGSEETPACPNCKSTHVERNLHAPNIVFKGTGFYKTDSSSSASAPKTDS